MKNIYDIIVVGGGPSGMIAAIRAAENGARVALVEKNNTLGKKLAITGGGRCNLTSDIPMDSFFEKIPHNAKFLHKSFKKFSNEDLVEFFRSEGICFQQEGHKIYPVSNSAKTIIDELENKLLKQRVDIVKGCEVTDFSGSIQEAFRIQTGRGTFWSKRLVFATGGYSFPATGSDGRIQELLSSKKIRTAQALPSLVRIHSNAEWITESTGISLEDVELTLLLNGKKAESLRGQILFTHSGISGPVAMDMTAYFTDSRLSDVRITADFLPNLSRDDILQILRKSPSRGIEMKLSGHLPKNLLKNIFRDLGEVDFHNMKKRDWSLLAERLKEAPIPITGIGGLKEAIITRGGIDVREIDPATMELRQLEGVYVAGEMIDVDALTGGYNLQIAFSTGFLAGEMAAKSTVQAL